MIKFNLFSPAFVHFLGAAFCEVDLGPNYKILISFFQVLEAVGPIIFLSTDTRKLRNEGFLSPYHPRYPDILTNSAHPLVM